MSSNPFAFPQLQQQGGVQIQPTYRQRPVDPNYTRGSISARSAMNNPYLMNSLNRLSNTMSQGGMGAMGGFGGMGGQSNMGANASNPTFFPLMALLANPQQTQPQDEDEGNFPPGSDVHYKHNPDGSEEIYIKIPPQANQPQAYGAGSNPNPYAPQQGNSPALGNPYDIEDPQEKVIQQKIKELIEKMLLLNQASQGTQGAGGSGNGSPAANPNEGLAKVMGQMMLLDLGIKLIGSDNLMGQMLGMHIVTALINNSQGGSAGMGGPSGIAPPEN